MVICFIDNCGHDTVISCCSFRRFPARTHAAKRWKENIRSDIPPSFHSKICVCHFEEGSKIPTLFLNNHVNGDFCQTERIHQLEAQLRSSRQRLGVADRCMYPALDTMDDECILAETGLPRRFVEQLDLALASYSYRFRSYRTSSALSATDRLFMTLVTLRRAYPLQHVGMLYRVAPDVVADVVQATVEALCDRLPAVLTSDSDMQTLLADRVPEHTVRWPAVDMALNLVQLRIEDNPERNYKKSEYALVEERNYVNVRYLMGVSNTGLIVFSSNLYTEAEGVGGICGVELTGVDCPLSIVCPDEALASCARLPVHSTVNFVKSPPVDCPGGEEGDDDDEGGGGGGVTSADLVSGVEHYSDAFAQTRRLLDEWAAMRRLPWQLSRYAGKAVRVCTMLANSRVPDLYTRHRFRSRNMQSLKTLRRRHGKGING